MKTVVQNSQSALPIIGSVHYAEPGFSSEELIQACARIRETAFIVREANNGRVGVSFSGQFHPDHQGQSCLGILPPLYPEWLGDRGFTELHGLRFPYVAGAMARGIASTAIVIEMARAGMLGFFGSAGLPLQQISDALDLLNAELGAALPWGCNLIHSPNQTGLEDKIVDLLLAKNVQRISASAYMNLSAAVVRFAFSGIHRDQYGRIVRRHVFAKISRPETARHFMSPPPRDILESLVRSGGLTAEEAALAATLPVAENYIVESDSGGHTDNQILTALFPTIAALRDELTRTHGYTRPIFLGAAGGLGTPSAVASAFSLGAAFVLTGSVNQGAIESGVSTDVKTMLAAAQLGDVGMCPCADMFELGVKVQVLKRGTMFAVRASQLYEIYTHYDSLDAIPADKRARLEKQMFRRPLDQVWADTRAFFMERDPKEAQRGDRDPKHRMALVFRWYLGMSSRWPITGSTERRIDYQVWCGPAMGAFNDWVRGTFLEAPENRTVVQIARNLLEGSAVITRAQQLRSYGVPLPASAFEFEARPLN